MSFWQAIESEHDRFEPEQCSRTDPAVILYTSGSTGEPKGVPIASNFLAAIRPYMQYGIDLKPTDMFWPTGDPDWGYGFVCYHVAMSMGIPVVSHEATPTAEIFPLVSAGSARKQFGDGAHAVARRNGARQREACWVRSVPALHQQLRRTT